MPLPFPCAILFDWHGTLVDTHDAMCRSVEELLPRFDELGLVEHLSPEGTSRSAADARLVRFIRIFRQLPPRVLAERRISRTDIFGAIFGDDRSAIRTAHGEYDAHYRQHFGKVVPFQPGIPERLAALRAVGIKVGIATNRRREFLDAELSALSSAGFDGLFDVAVCGDEVPNRKPAPDVLLEAHKRLDLPEDAPVWFVGDSASDVITAQAAGFPCVFYNGALWDATWFERVFTALDGSAPPPPSAVVEDLDDLLDLVAESASEQVRAQLAAARPAERALRVPPPVHIQPRWQAAIDTLERPSVVLFDWHATLVDTLDAMYRAVDDVLPELAELQLLDRLVKPEDSRSIDDRRLVEYVRSFGKLHPKIKADRKISRTDIFEVLFGNDEEAKRIAHEAFNRHYRKHFGDVQPFEPEVREVLEALRALGLKVGVITNRDREFFATELEKVDATGWTHLFDTSVCGDDAERRKPNPDQVLLATRNVGAEPGPHVWYVGDSTTDTVAAKTAGVTSIFFNGAQWDRDWLDKIFPGTERFPHRPDAVVNDFSEFWAMVLACLEKR